MGRMELLLLGFNLLAIFSISFGSNHGPPGGKTRPPGPMGEKTRPPVLMGGEDDSPGPMGGADGSPGPMGGEDDSSGPMGGEDDSSRPMGGADGSPGPMGGEDDSSGPMGGEDDSSGPMGGAEDSPGPMGGKKCCMKKEVGGYIYHLMGRVDRDLTEYECWNKCVYKMMEDPDPESEYCFKKGGLPSMCLASDVDWSPIVPKYLAVPPQFNLQLSFSGLPVEANQLVSTGDMMQRPSVSGAWAKEGSLYTVMIVDLGLSEREGGRQYVHWFVTNIPGTHISQGTEALEYVPPFSFHLNDNGRLDLEWVAPEPMLALAFNQTKVIVQAEETQAGCNTSIARERIIDFRELAKKYGLDIVAASYFHAPYGDATNSLLCKFTRCLGRPFPAPLPGINDGPDCQASK